MHEKTIVSALKLTGFVFLIWGIWALLSTAIQSYDQIDVIYLNLFFRAKLMPPLLAIFFGALIYLLSRHLARFFRP